MCPNILNNNTKSCDCYNELFDYSFPLATTDNVKHMHIICARVSVYAHANAEGLKIKDCRSGNNLRTSSCPWDSLI